MSSSENLPPMVMRLVMREIQKLNKSPPFGVRYLPGDEDNCTTIYAELEGPSETPFVGGRFVVKLVVDSSFPASPPRGFFVTKIFHPNVSTAGEICVNALKKDWKPNLGLAHVLKVIWCLLLVPFPESSLNDEAGRLFMESYEEYSKKASMMTRIYAIERGGVATPTTPSSSSASSSQSSESSSGATPKPRAPKKKSSAFHSPHKSLKSKNPNRLSPEHARGKKKRRTPGSASGGVSAGPTPTQTPPGGSAGIDKSAPSMLARKRMRKTGTTSVGTPTPPSSHHHHHHHHHHHQRGPQVVSTNSPPPTPASLHNNTNQNSSHVTTPSSNKGVGPLTAGENGSAGLHARRPSSGKSLSKSKKNHRRKSLQRL